MSRRIARWMLAIVMTIFVAGVYAPAPAEAQVVVRVGPHHRHHRHHRRAYYRHGHRYYR
ncbi:hypothetical protein [Granulicella arctica]|uniref:Uncharacterized protein n=1 Tax=Granulicella arctica TaxID=940613 RepID=A0A7Y9PJJ6_9BACT|nr:hypothetical protein [Granulicella arctica]NYF80939.1 hypothetical protein [Granulicella arctica]